MKGHHIDNIFNEMIDDVRYIDMYSRVYSKTHVNNN